MMATTRKIWTPTLVSNARLNQGAQRDSRDNHFGGDPAVFFRLVINVRAKPRYNHRTACGIVTGIVNKLE